MNEEAIRWKMVAAYLASCHAATLESMPKSAPKGERRRQAEICRKSAEYLRGNGRPKLYGQSTDAVMDTEIKWCENAARKHDVQ